MPTRTTRATDDDKDQLDVAAKCAADADEANARYDPIDKGWRKGEATTLVPLRRWEAWLADKGFAVGPSASATGMPRYTREHRQARRMLQNEQRHRLDVDELYRVLIRQQMEKQAEGRSAEPEASWNRLRRSPPPVRKRKGSGPEWIPLRVCGFAFTCDDFILYAKKYFPEEIDALARTGDYPEAQLLDYRRQEAIIYLKEALDDPRSMPSISPTAT
ncbi:hypothetical protein IMY05_C1151001200 [Salix suchowensis]|nr:hypothetical protein IMY05_C1151001200 [Salix suchowensis]